MLIRKWFPQNDILAHKKVILFISHGGLFGTSESLYHGVPLLLIPFFNDQHRNSHRVVKAGYGKFLSYSEINNSTLSNAVNEIISNDSFMKRAKQISAIFRDNLVPPMDEAMYWIEHVAKFKGAEHLRSHAVHLSWYSYLLLDIIIVNLIGIFVILFAIYYLIRKLIFHSNIEYRSKKQD